MTSVYSSIFQIVQVTLSSLQELGFLQIFCVIDYQNKMIITTCYNVECQISIIFLKVFQAWTKCEIFTRNFMVYLKYLNFSHSRNMLPLATKNISLKVFYQCSIFNSSYTLQKRQNFYCHTETKKNKLSCLGHSGMLRNSD